MNPNSNKFEDSSNYIGKIINQLPNILFQFTISSDYIIGCDYMNGPFFNFYELTVQDVLERTDDCIKERIHPEDINLFNSSIVSCFKSLERWELSFRVLLPKKGLKWITTSAKTERLENGSVIFYGVQSDVTQLKNSQQELEISEARSQFANMASNVGVWDWNLVTNKVFYSKESLEILELEENAKELSNPEFWDDKVHPEDREIYFGNIKLHFDGIIPYYETVHRVLCNNKYKWILDRGKVISRDENGKPTRIVGTHTDVSNQKNKEEKLLKTLELVNDQKNKLLNFAHIVSHNLKNHTGNLSSLIEMKETDILTTDEFSTYLKTVSVELSNTILNLEELVKVQETVTITKVNLNLNEYLDKTFKVLFDDINKSNAIIINNIPVNVTVKFIPAYLESILLNLTSNAIKYSSVDRKLEIIYTVEIVDNFIILSVKDNGLGIDLYRHKDSVFGLYKTFHANEDSRGVGLYLSKNQIESLNGKIEVESEINIGTTFKVFFNEEF